MTTQRKFSVAVVMNKNSHMIMVQHLWQRVEDWPAQLQERERYVATVKSETAGAFTNMNFLARNLK